MDDFSPDKFTFNECLDTGTLLKCSQKDSINFGRCFNKTAIDGSLASCSSNQTDLKQVGFWKTSFPSADYWKYSVLEQSDSIEETGGFVWHLLYKFLVVYVIAYIILIRGIKVRICPRFRNWNLEVESELMYPKLIIYIFPKWQIWHKTFN